MFGNSVGGDSVTFEETLALDKTIVIHTRTQDEFRKIIDFLYERGYSWTYGCGRCYERYFMYKTDTAIEYNQANNRIRFGIFDYLKSKSPNYSYYFEYDQIIWESEPSVNFEDIY